MEEQRTNPAAEPVRLDIGQKDALQDWSRRFGVSEAELTSAVLAVGPVSKDVWEYLQRGSSRRSTAPRRAGDRNYSAGRSAMTGAGREW